MPDEEFWPGLLAVSDVMGTGWYAADAAEVKPGSTAVVVGDGAVGLCGVIAAKELGAERIIAMSRHDSRQKLAREFGATDIVTERGEEGVARDQGADRRDRRRLASWSASAPPSPCSRPCTPPAPAATSASSASPTRSRSTAQELFFSHVGLRGGPAPVRRYLPDLIDRVLTGRINPGKVFDLTLPLDEVAEGYQAMDERRAIKTLLKP